MRKVYLIVFLLFNFTIQGQTDTLPYNMFKDRFVLKSSLGYNSAPFSIRGNFDGEKEVLKYRANMNAVMGVDFSYKWLSIGLNFTLPGYLKDTDKFGETQYFDFNFNVDVKKWFLTFDIHNYTGFSLLNAKRFSPTLVAPGNRNQLKPKMQSASISINAYRFQNVNFKMKPALGIVGNYKQEVKSFYVKYTTNLHGISSPDGLLPHEYINDNRSILQSTLMSAFDFGAVPGYVYVNNINGWQFGGFAGLGVVLQAKFYEFDNTTRGFLGLAPRIDLRLQGGYNVEDWFVMFDAAFDNKSIRFNDVQFRQSYYYIRLLYGYRFEKKKK